MAEKLVKICGLKTVEAAECAISNGANLLGVILVPNRSRTVDDATAREISRIAKSHQRISSKELIAKIEEIKVTEKDYDKWFDKMVELIIANGPYLVGVFRNQSIDEVNSKIEKADLDFVQLHGSEDFDEYINNIEVPVITRYVLDSPKLLKSLEPKKHILTLLDSEAGGEGIKLNWEQVDEFGKTENARYILAGGLNPENIHEAINLNGCVGVDVSGGVETNGMKDLAKIKKFLENARN
ncbi:hypothetical protein PACTADRAFT_3807 [Pachysolen tannophilus NRRL Y-2460]|uniref:N-(5'-phosphoribosyl)anthranilate isomerase n=1 Tax=Pachysolen tannophilus NRRL Y-2460 TaxID=669874 RepID=A0A1E4TT45_PACTA|nr:hypothetical protein PACTADRAFT_3807 [Pachysolen tannophilus NRRL Y-2460]